MDNLTHTLIGVATAHSLPKRFRKPSVYWASAIGNNLPDADWLYSRMPDTSSLDYLVHHRGYTHTFFFSIFLAYIGAVFAAWIGNPAGQRKVNLEVYLFTLLGCFFHIGADFLNSYGVHPFSPFVNTWYFGDTLFILEPWIWVLVIPGAFFMAKRLTAKLMWIAVLSLGLALVWKTSHMPLSLQVMTTLTAGLSFFVHWKRKDFKLASVSLVAVIALFATFSLIVKNQVQKSTSIRLADIEATPSPGNPLCWSSWTKSLEGDDYVMRSAVIAPFPLMFSLDSCDSRRDVFARHGMPQKIEMPGAKSNTVLWQYEVRLNQKLLQETLKCSCVLQKHMSFLRFPYLMQTTDGFWLSGDLRYDTRNHGNFTQMTFKTVDCNVKCPDNNIPWDSPFFGRK